MLDCRPLDEHLRGHIPGAVHCPGAELVYRVPGLIRDAKTSIVVHCAGRTRSIVGAESLRQMGLANPVAALKNGTMGWQLAGMALEHDGAADLPQPSGTENDRLQARARDMREEHGIQALNAEQLAAWMADATRTTYRFDVRSAAEFKPAYPPGFAHAPGGQLLQQLDEFAPVRGARMVLADDDSLRATITAAWLRQMGWREVAIVPVHLQANQTVAPDPSAQPHSPQHPQRTITAQELQGLIDAGHAQLIDLSRSTAYRESHIPGAWFAVRARLPAALAKVPAGKQPVLSSTDGVIAAWASTDPGIAPGIAVLEGGNQAWQASGLPLGPEHPVWADEVDDVYVLPYDYVGDVASQMQAYIDWELTLIEQMARDGSVSFGLDAH